MFSCLPYFSAKLFGFSFIRLLVFFRVISSNLLVEFSFIVSECPVCIDLPFVDISLIFLLSPILSSLFPLAVLFCFVFFVLPFLFCFYMFQRLSLLFVSRLLSYPQLFFYASGKIQAFLYLFDFIQLIIRQNGKIPWFLLFSLINI